MRVLILFEQKWHVLSIMRCLADVGVKCHAFGVGKCWDIQLSKYCHGYMGCPQKSYWRCSPEFIQKINEYCFKQKIDCLVPGDYASTLFLSKVRDRLNPEVKFVAVANTETLEILNHKWKFSQLLKTHNIPQPQTFLVENVEQLKSIPLSLPCAVKPLVGGGRWTGGRFPGSYIKKNQDEYLASAQQGFPLLVQEFISGSDVGLNIFAEQGRILAWTMQEFVGNERLRFFQSSQLLELGERIVSAVNFQGLANIDLRLDQRDGKYKVIECNPRFWGSLRASKWTGVNFPVLAVNAALGKDVSGQIRHKDIEYVFPSRVLAKLFRGNVSALRGLPEATRRDLGQIISDPLSCLYSVFERR